MKKIILCFKFLQKIVLEWLEFRQWKKNKKTVPAQPDGAGTAPAAPQPDSTQKGGDGPSEVKE